MSYRSLLDAAPKYINPNLLPLVTTEIRSQFANPLVGDYYPPTKILPRFEGIDYIPTLLTEINRYQERPSLYDPELISFVRHGQAKEVRIKGYVIDPILPYISIYFKVLIRLTYITMTSVPRSDNVHLLILIKKYIIDEPNYKKDEQHLLISNRVAPLYELFFRSTRGIPSGFNRIDNDVWMAVQARLRDGNEFGENRYALYALFKDSEVYYSDLSKAEVYLGLVPFTPSKYTSDDAARAAGVLTMACDGWSYEDLVVMVKAAMFQASDNVLKGFVVTGEYRRDNVLKSFDNDFQYFSKIILCSLLTSLRGSGDITAAINELFPVVTVMNDKRMQLTQGQLTHKLHSLVGENEGQHPVLDEILAKIYVYLKVPYAREIKYISGNVVENRNVRILICLQGLYEVLLYWSDRKLIRAVLQPGSILVVLWNVEYVSARGEGRVVVVY